MFANDSETDLFLIHPDGDAGVVKDVGVLFSVHAGKSRDSGTPLQDPSALFPASQPSHAKASPVTRADNSNLFLAHF